jgi:hypothetical protein
VGFAVSPSPWSGHPAAELEVECGGKRHRVRWESGEIVAPDHGDVVGERALAALGRRRLACLRFLDAWNAHSDDLRVLSLSTRGPGDPTPTGVSWGDEPPGMSGQSVARLIRSVIGGRAAKGLPPQSPLQTLAMQHGHDQVAELLISSGALGDRLVATVAATWADRIRSGDPAVDAQRPALTACLYGRVALALRDWIGVAHDAVSLTMIEPDGPLRIARGDEGGIDVDLPFEWVANVWARRLSVVLGRFVLGAEATPEGLRLQTVDQSLRGIEEITISV